jgi:PhzF family phenazine biosynthesis protein
MRYITKELRVSETAFVYPSIVADYNLKFFSSQVEVELCGHATIATFFTMAKEKRLLQQNHTIKQETKVGVLPVDIIYGEDQELDRVMMTQVKPEFRKISIDFNELADSLNIAIDEIDESLPKESVSTGLFTLPILIKSFKTLRDIKPDIDKIKNICIKLDVGSFHLFSFETIDSKSLYHARNFPP